MVQLHHTTQNSFTDIGGKLQSIIGTLKIQASTKLYEELCFVSRFSFTVYVLQNVSYHHISYSIFESRAFVKYSIKVNRYTSRGNDCFFYLCSHSQLLKVRICCFKCKFFP